ncbi:hypothetical protein BGZ73_002015 [Actinomortierella ambigua]|nr:hypothetical protein BGZ73_002015 [Actinomortierella ambigua]
MWDSPAATSAFTAAFNAQVLTRPQEVVLAATLHGSEPLGHYVREMSLSMIPHRWDQIEGLHLLALCRGCPFLERLDLRDCQRVREVQFWSSIFASPTLPYTLKSLTLSGCHLITDLTISLVCEFMQCLEHLDVSNCETLTDWMLMELASSPEKQTAEEQGRMAEESEMEYRESLMIMDALVLDDFNTKSAGRSGLKKPGRFRFLIKYARSLPSLSLDGPSDTYTLYAGRKPWFPPTASLPNIADNGELSERTAFSRLRVHKTLKHLDISGCISITDVGIEALRQGAEQLQSLNLEGCYGVLMVDNEDLPGAEWEDVTDDSDDEGGGNMP